MRKLQVDVDKLLEISAGLPHGTNKEVARRTGYHPETVSRVRNGKEFNPTILKELVEIYETARNTRVELLNRIEEVVKAS